MEDFNTITLPHRKFYNLAFYEQERAAKAAKKGKPVVRTCMSMPSVLVSTSIFGRSARARPAD